MIVDSCMPMNPAVMTPEVWTGRVWLGSDSFDGLIPVNGYQLPSPPFSVDSPPLGGVGVLEPHSLYMIGEWSQSFMWCNATGGAGLTELWPASEAEFAAACSFLSWYSYGIQPRLKGNVVPVGLSAMLVGGVGSSPVFQSLSYRNSGRQFIANNRSEEAVVSLLASGWISQAVELPPPTTPAPTVTNGVWSLSMEVYRITDPGIIEEYWRRNS